MSSPYLFDACDPADRQLLIEALAAIGIAATETGSGGGTFHVALTLFHDDDDHELQLITGEGLDTRYGCAVGFVGMRGGRQVAGPLIPVATLEDATGLFRLVDNTRDYWMDQFDRGAFDI